MPPRKRDSSEQPVRRRPATTPEAREQQMIALADALAERQLREGTASAQVITHYLKLGTTREQLEQEKLRKENLLREAQIDQMASAARIEELYSKALDAMRSYGGQTPDD
jgi:chorismate synthase